MVDKNGIKTVKGTRVPGSGRKKGTRNKIEQSLHDLAEKLNINPFRLNLLVADGRWQELGLRSEFETKYNGRGEPIGKVYALSMELRQRAMANACEYLFQKRKSVEHSGTIDTGETKQIPITDDLIEKIVDKLEERC